MPSDPFHRKLIFFEGKGGVGKTRLSRALAVHLTKLGRRVLWVEIESPTRPAGETLQTADGYTSTNAEASHSFQQYAGIKLKSAALTKIFVANSFVRTLAKASPGIHELVILGKIWYEIRNFDHVIVDMPSTGYGLAMFRSTENFMKLFGSGPLFRDSSRMLETFSDPEQCAHLVVALPEELPLLEAKELSEFLLSMFPGNLSHLLINRCIEPEALLAPSTNELDRSAESPNQRSTTTNEDLVPRDLTHYAFIKSQQEQESLGRFLSENRLVFGSVSLFPFTEGALWPERIDGSRISKNLISLKTNPEGFST